MPIRLDNNGKRKALICEELKPETRYEEHVRIEVGTVSTVSLPMSSSGA